MAVRNSIRSFQFLICFVLFFVVPTLQARAWDLSGPVGLLAQQQHAGQGKGQDADQDPWAEESERIDGLEFGVDGNWRSTVPDQGFQGMLTDEEVARMLALRTEAKKRQRALWLAWKERIQKIQSKWGTFRESSPTVYVEYAENNDAFGGVDYEKGWLEVGAIAPVLYTDSPLRIERMLSERLSRLLQAESMPGLRDLEGQVAMPGRGSVVTQEDVEEFSKTAVRSGGPPQRYLAPDGVRRLRKEVRIDLMPDHLQTRVSRVLPYVQRASRIYEVAPELILAVIQTESVFNPRAVSNDGAVGLMQLMPASGALEASKLVYGETRLLTREELSRPDRNIELGAAYLRILLRRYFAEHSRDPQKALFLAIASYNCGPQRVMAALGDRDLEILSSAELYDLLIRVVPPETQVYLQRVVRNMEQYRSVMGSTPWMRFVRADIPTSRYARLLLSSEYSRLLLFVQ